MADTVQLLSEIIEKANELLSHYEDWDNQVQVKIQEIEQVKQNYDAELNQIKQQYQQELATVNDEWFQSHIDTTKLETTEDGKLTIKDIFLRKDIDQVVEGRITFTKKVNIEGDLEVKGQSVLAPIKKPSIVTPKNNATDFYGTITSSEFEVADNYLGTHVATDWEISSDSEFKNIVESSYNDTVNLTSYTPSNLEPLTTYYVRVRYRSEDFISPWSDPIQFTTCNAFIAAPTISGPSNGTLYPTFTLTPFNAVGWSDNWESTEWQIATDENFNNIIYSETKTDVADKLTIDSDILDIDTTYYVRAKYNGDQGHSSNWSATYVYNTSKYVLEYSIPEQENELTTININVTHDNGRTFDVSEYVLEGHVSHGSLTISGMTAIWELPEVSEDTPATISLKVIRTSDSVQVTETVSKSLTIKNVTLVADTAISISDFSDYDYNDGWEI